MRIIGGRVGGRTLKAPKGASTRPTSDKVRQAIFNILVARADPPARVLDLYAGSGALGLEALRAARSVGFFSIRPTGRTRRASSKKRSSSSPTSGSSTPAASP
ncbi:MAG: RsmD family RNA methyltransferase [Myxococcales bacterium]|nr:RsmD family RNA methyltransferase [Myxococcales bacterium]